jgi:hypothetical protein
MLNDQPPLLRFFPLLLLSGVVALSCFLKFNGIDGVEDPECQRASVAIFNHWQGTAGKYESAHAYNQIYAFLGAMLQYLFKQPNMALQVVSWLAFAVSGWLVERIVATLAHGSRTDSRMSFVFLGWVLAPVVVASGLGVGGALLEMTTVLSAFLFGLRCVEQTRASDIVWVALFTLLSVIMRPILAGLLLPLALVSGWGLVKRREWNWLSAAILVGTAVGAMVAYDSNHWMCHVDGRALQNWSPAHFFQRSFDTENGISRHLLPNVVFLLFPIMHPGFCLLLPGLLLLAKKTDLTLPAKKTVLFALCAYSMVIGGLPQQPIGTLMPSYAMVLFLLFPAWDRFYCYGLYFLKKHTRILLFVALLLQLLLNAWSIYST